MKRTLLWMVGALCAALLVPTNALAFAVTADRTTIFVGETVQLTLSGQAADTTQFFVGVTPDLPPNSPFTYFSSTSAVFTYVGSTTGTTPLPFAEIDTSQAPPVFGLLSAEFDPNTFEQLPFSVVDGPIFQLTLEGVLPTAPFTTVQFDVCTALDCINDLISGQVSPLLTRLTIDITILQRDGTPVPEPATLWLAFAALIAGGAVFRNGSKRS